MAKCPPPLPLSPCAVEQSLARSLISVADDLRSLYEDFGLRPYRLLLVKTRWSGGARGVGVEEVASVYEFRPTPLLEGLDSLTEEAMGSGSIERGQVEVSEVSGAETETSLRGFDAVTGLPPTEAETVFYEIEQSPPGGPPYRRRFTLRGTPNYDAGAFQWTFKLERAYADRSPSGDPP